MSLNCEQDGEKKASEHFHSSFDPETCLKNANISTGALGILNLHLCTQCHTRHSTRKLLDEHVIQNHPDLIGLISGKVYECPNCTYKTTLSTNLTKHVLRNCEVTAQQNFKACKHCNKTFRSRKILNDHFTKVHPDLIVTGSSTRYECTRCAYKTIIKSKLDEHMLTNHPDLPESDDGKMHECPKCSYKTTAKLNLDNHILRKHSDLSATISSKIYECTQCTYKTTHRGCLFVHKLKHPETAHIGKLRCIHCSLSFNNDRGLDNHILKKHPSYSSSIRSKIYECPHCAYKTTNKSNLASHMLIHAETVDSHKIHECTKCTYKTTIKAHFGNHILKKHPDLSETVSSKIHKCTNCAYKTTNKSCFSAHLLKHSETDNKHKLHGCPKCAYKSTFKKNLDDHVLRKHPDISATVSSKIHVCTKCTYKTTNRSALAVHELKHS
nr:unnamed protein product [Callosobruchus chinensis]